MKSTEKIKEVIQNIDMKKAGIIAGVTISAVVLTTGIIAFNKNSSNSEKDTTKTEKIIEKETTTKEEEKIVGLLNNSDKVITLKDESGKEKGMISMVNLNLNIPINIITIMVVTFLGFPGLFAIIGLLLLI